MTKKTTKTKARDTQTILPSMDSGGLQQVWWGVGVIGLSDDEKVAEYLNYNCEVSGQIILKLISKATVCQTLPAWVLR